MSQTERRSTRSWLEAPPGYAAWAAAGAAVCALGAALLGQWLLDRRPASPWGWAPLLAGAGAFAWLLRGEALERARGRGQAAARSSLPWLGAALALAALAFAGLGGNLFRPLPTAAWLAALALLYCAFRYEDGVSPRQLVQSARAGVERLLGIGRSDGLRLSRHALALIGILLVGAFLRLYQLDAIPREMGTDMPHNYENARQIMQGRFMIFCPSYPGRESLFFYLVAAYSKVFGLGYLSIKSTSALVGLVTIAALYGVARDLFDRRVALLGAALLSVSKWHVILSRTGYRASLMPLLVLAVLYLIVRALRSGRASDWVLAGMAIGLGMYTYNAFMIVPAAVALALAVELALEGRGALRRRGWGLAGLAMGALFVFLPLARYALEAPQSYFFRVATRVTDIEQPLPADLLGVLAGNLWRAAGMFNLHGDEVSYSNIPDQRHLGAISAVLFLCGLGLALARWRRGHNALVLVFLGSLILPTALSVAFPREVPNAVRASGAIAPAYLLAALPLAAVARRLSDTGRLSSLAAQPPPGSGAGVRRAPALPGLLAAVLAAALLGAELVETHRAYFGEYVAHLPGRNYAISLEIARVLDDFAPEGQAFVKIWPYWFDGNALRAQLQVMSRSWDWEVPELDPAKPPLATARGKLLFIVHPDDQATLEMLEAEFPGGVAIRHRDYNGQPAFVTFYGER